MSDQQELLTWRKSFGLFWFTFEPLKPFVQLCLEKKIKDFCGFLHRLHVYYRVAGKHWSTKVQQKIVPLINLSNYLSFKHKLYLSVLLLQMFSTKTKLKHSISNNWLLLQKNVHYLKLFHYSQNCFRKVNCKNSIEKQFSYLKSIERSKLLRLSILNRRYLEEKKKI
jgi:hypothetical protein